MILILKLKVEKNWEQIKDFEINKKIKKIKWKKEKNYKKSQKMLN